MRFLAYANLYINSCFSCYIQLHLSEKVYVQSKQGNATPQNQP